ncbi:MAG: AAA family ATPase [Chloroflexi bacterium]|nr:AAA family ATPase [Chloroflexota bacterium]
MTTKLSAWWKYTGSGKPHDFSLPPAPDWRTFISPNTNGARGQKPNQEIELYEPETLSKKNWTADELHRAKTFEPTHRMIELVNAALYLRRPLLITGKPGTGKSSLAYAVAYELKLGQVLTWPVTSRSTLEDALYRYDALGRLQDTNLEQSQKQGKEANEAPLQGGKTPNPLKSKDIGQYIRLGPLGTALLPTRNPQVLLIDEIDKSSIDLPNDLLNIFETGKYEIKELSRLENDWVDVLPQYGEKKFRIYHGKVTCNEFPFVIMTSNGERDLPLPFLRRCIRLDIKEPDDKQLSRIVEKKFPKSKAALRSDVLKLFKEKKKGGGILATDQLLNAIYLRMQNVDLLAELDEKNSVGEDDQEQVKEKLKDSILRKLNEQ